MRVFGLGEGPMIKTAATVGAAALVAGFVAFVGPNVQAGTPKAETIVAPVATIVPAATAKADRLAVKVPGAGCSQRAWPYYEQDCLVDFEARWSGEPRKVRIVTTDRLR
jgi:hypothetical protein